MAGVVAAETRRATLGGSSPQVSENMNILVDSPSACQTRRNQNHIVNMDKATMTNPAGSCVAGRIEQSKNTFDRARPGDYLSGLRFSSAHSPSH
jgi:hypothetical protein